MSEQQIQTIQSNGRMVTEGNGAPFSSLSAFEGAMRMAKALAAMDFVPQAYRGNMANCLLALEIAHRTGASFLAVMQNLVLVQGKPSWEAKYIIGSLNTCGRFQHLEFEQEGAPDPQPANWQAFPDAWRCRARAKDLGTGTMRAGPWVSIAMAKAEGWIQKGGSKWQSMPELMLMYRAASFFGKLFAPEVMLGMQTRDEALDTITVDQASGEVLDVETARGPAHATGGRTAQVAERIRAAIGTQGKAMEASLEREPGSDDE
jgi:hypothetical protein